MRQRGVTCPDSCLCLRAPALAMHIVCFHSPESFQTSAFNCEALLSPALTDPSSSLEKGLVDLDSGVVIAGGRGVSGGGWGDKGDNGNGKKYNKNNFLKIPQIKSYLLWKTFSTPLGKSGSILVLSFSIIIFIWKSITPSHYVLLKERDCALLILVVPVLLQHLAHA